MPASSENLSQVCYSSLLMYVEFCRALDALPVDKRHGRPTAEVDSPLSVRSDKWQDIIVATADELRGML